MSLNNVDVLLFWKQTIISFGVFNKYKTKTIIEHVSNYGSFVLNKVVRQCIISNKTEAR